MESPTRSGNGASRNRDTTWETSRFTTLRRAPGRGWPVYYYLSAEGSRSTQEKVLAFTHNDTFKPLPGYQVMVGHFHTRFTEMLEDAGTMDLQPGFVPVFRGLGDQHRDDVRFPRRLAHAGTLARFGSASKRITSKPAAAFPIAPS